MVLPELKRKYGPDVDITLGVKLEEEHTQRAIQFNSKRGIVFGDIASEVIKTNV
jgi:hypothetical protein